MNLCAVPVLLALLSPPAFSQASDAGAPANATPYHLQAGTQAVVLDVVVTDSNGVVVTNLTRDDFTVYEDKVLQSIRTFDPPPSVSRNPNPPLHSTAELDRLEPEAPVTLIVLDEINTSFQDEAFARYSLEQYLNKQGPVLDHPTLLGAVDLNRFTLLHDYTTSRQELLDALQKHKVIYPYHLEGASWRAQQFFASFEGLLEVTDATAGHQGHKTLLWVGRGFPPFDPEGLSQDDEEGIKHIIETCTNTMRNARVVLYTLDPAGETTEPESVDSEGFPEDPFDGELDFSKMAQATGGHAFFGRNDVDKLIDVSTNEGASFYTLSYKPSTPITYARNFHSIRVVMKNPNLHAETREGYYIHPPPAPARTEYKHANMQTFDLGLAMQSTLPYDGIHLTVKRLPDDPDKFAIAIHSSDLSWTPGSSQKLITRITVIAESFDKSGAPVGHTIKLSTLQDGQSPSSQTPVDPVVNVLTTAPTKAPATRVRILIRDEATQKLGAIDYPLNAAAPVSN